MTTKKNGNGKAGKHIGSTLESLFEETGELKTVRALTKKKLQSGVPDETWHLFHTLWTNAVGTPKYDKKQWQKLEAWIIATHAKARGK